MNTNQPRRIGLGNLGPGDETASAAHNRHFHLAPVPSPHNENIVVTSTYPPHSEEDEAEATDKDEVELDELTGTPLRPPSSHAVPVDILPEDIQVIKHKLIPPYPVFSDPEPMKWHNVITKSHDKWSARREAYMAADQDWRRAFEYYKELIWSYYTEMPLLACVVHSKGGAGKTPTITNIAAAVSIATGQLTVLYDCNPDLGGASGRSGLYDGATVTHEELLALIRQPDFNLSKLSAKMQPTRHRVLVVAADADEIAHTATHDQIREIIEVLRRHSRAVFVDLGTNITGPNNSAVHEMADVLIFPMRTTSGFHTINGPVDGRIGTHRKLVSLSKSNPADPHDTIAFKANYALTVALGMRPSDDIVAFRDQIGHRNAMTVIPYDDAAAADQAVWHPVGDEPLHDVPLRASANTALAWLRAAAEMYQQAFLVREYIDSIHSTHNS